MNNVVEVNRLAKSYGDVTAVTDISFTIESGKIYGLLGRNGAGKTTIMHMITAQLFATSGELKVFGEDPYENAQVLNQVCFIKESQKYPENYRVIDVLEVASLFYRNWDAEYAHSLVKDFQLPLKRRVKKLSRGMLSSVGIVVGLASRSPLTIFDEPYLGLDAVSRSLFYDRLIEDYAEHPRTIVLSTHLIDEVSKMLEHIIVIDKGNLILNQDAEALRGRGFSVVGPASKVDSFIEGKEIIHQEAIGGMVSSTILGSIVMEERKQAEELGLELVPISLQQLVIHLTKDHSNKRVVQI